MEKRMDMLEREVARLRRQMVDLFPRDTSRVPYQPTLENSLATFAQAVTLAGGHDAIALWGLGRLMEGTNGKLDASRVDDMQRYPVAPVDGMDMSKLMFVCGPGPLEVDAGHIAGIPEFGRAGVFALMVLHGLVFYNGQLPLAPCEKWIVRYLSALRQSTGAVVTLYDAPWRSWLEAGVFLWFFGGGNPRVFVVQQCAFDVAQFDEGSEKAKNLPGAPIGSLTLRQRQLEVYDILRRALRLYEEQVRSPRICQTYWGPGVDGEVSLDQLLVSAAGPSGTTAAASGTIGLGARKTIGAELFNSGTQMSDVSRYLKSIYVLGMYAPLARLSDEYGLIFGAACGDVRGMLAGFVCGTRDAHWHQMEPLAYLLRGILVDHGVDVVEDWHHSS